jgi:hypothetical protein
MGRKICRAAFSGVPPPRARSCHRATARQISGLTEPRDYQQSRASELRWADRSLAPPIDFRVTNLRPSLPFLSSITDYCLLITLSDVGYDSYR